MSEPPSSPPIGVPASPRTIPADSPGSWASPEANSNQSDEEIALPRQRSTSSSSSNSDTVTNSLISDPFSESDTSHAPTSPPPTGDDLDGPYKLFLTRRQLGKNIRRLNRIPAAYRNGELCKKIVESLESSWEKMICEAELTFLVNTFCLTCEWGPIQTDPSNTHPQTPAMLQMVDDLKTDMRATDPESLTQEMLDGFKLRWWNCENKYMEDNIGNVCDGINVLPRRDFARDAGEVDSQWEEESYEEYYVGQYTS